MKLSAPTQPIFMLAVLLGVLGIIGTLVTIPFITDYGFWLLAAGFVILTLGNMMKGV
ncbi:MAG: hypothetical protein AAF633_27625 [Chloroflexota bacterium]